MKTAYRRVLIKLSGGQLAGESGFGISPVVIGRIAEEIRQVHELGSQLFDMSTDPGQTNPLDNPEIEHRMIAHIIRLMKENDAPPEQFDRLGLDAGA